MREANTLSLIIGQSTYTVVVLKERYVQRRLAVELFDESSWESFATVSVNVPGIRLADDEFVFKTYSENEGLLEQMLAAGYRRADRTSPRMSGRSAVCSRAAARWRIISLPTAPMVNWPDAIFGGEEELPCVLDIEREDMRVKVLEHAVPEIPSGTGYLIEVYSFSDLRIEWQLVARFGDFDLHTVISLLADAATELYRIRVIGVYRPPEKQ